MIPSRLLEDLVLGEPHRLAIACALAQRGGAASFVEVRNLLGLTDGNLNRHLRRLEMDALIGRHRGRPQGAPAGRTTTTLILTEAGRERLSAYADSLDQAASIARQAAALVRLGSEAGPAVSASPRKADAFAGSDEGGAGHPSVPEEPAPSIVEERFIGPD